MSKESIWKVLSELPPLTEIQKLNYHRGFLIRQKERLSSQTFYDPVGVYGTAASNYSANHYACKEIDEMIMEIDERISKLQENKITEV